MNFKIVLNSPILNFFRKIDQKKKFWFFLVLVLFLGFFLRVYKIGQQSFLADEFLGINVSYGYQQTGQWKFWDFNQEKLTEEVYVRANVYYWQVAQVLNWLGLGEGNSRLVSVAWGMVGIFSLSLWVYLFSKNWIWAILTGLFLAISPTALTFDRKLRMYSMFAPVFFFFSMSIFWFLEKKIEKKPKWLKKIQEKMGLNFLFLPLVFLLGILSLATHLLTVNIFPIVLIYFLVMAIKDYWQNKKILNRYSGYFGGMILITLLAIQNQEIRNSLNFFSFVSNWSYFEKLIFDYSHPILAGTFLFLGIYYLIKNYSKTGVWIVINFLIILFLAVFIWKRNAGLQYLYFITFFKTIIFSAGVLFLTEIFSKKIFSGSTKAFWSLVTFWFLLLPNWNFFFSDRGFYQDIKKWKVPNYREVYDYYIKNRSANSAIISRPLASYYLNKTRSAVLEYGVDNPLTLERLLEAQNKYNEIWAIFSKDTYIKKDVEKYIRENFELVKTNYTNDVLFLYVWRK